MARPKTAKSVPISAPLRETRTREQIAKRDFSGPAGTTRQGETAGLRERKKARLRQQIVETAVKLFRKRGYEKTRVNDIVRILEISQPTFFRYFPSKDAVLREMEREASPASASSSSLNSPVKRLPRNACAASIRALRALRKPTGGCGRPSCWPGRWNRCGRRICGSSRKSQPACSVKFSRKGRSAVKSRGSFRSFISPSSWKGFTTRWFGNGRWTSPGRMNWPNVCAVPLIFSCWGQSREQLRKPARD